MLAHHHEKSLSFLPFSKKAVKAKSQATKIVWYDLCFEFEFWILCY